MSLIAVPKKDNRLPIPLNVLVNRYLTAGKGLSDIRIYCRDIDEAKSMLNYLSDNCNLSFNKRYKLPKEYIRLRLECGVTGRPYKIVCDDMSYYNCRTWTDTPYESPTAYFDRIYYRAFDFKETFTRFAIETPQHYSYCTIAFLFSEYFTIANREE